MSSALDRVLARFPDAKQGENAWSAKCPAHDDKSPSLSISERTKGDPGVVLNCHAGCATEAVVAAIGLKMSDLFDRHDGSTSTGRRIVATYPYHDADGEVVYEVVRFDPKDFRQRRPDGRGGWLWNLKGVPRVLYRLPAVIAAVDAGELVYVVEGEKDADALVSAGVCATTSPQGAGNFDCVAESARDVLTGAQVVVVHDQDDPGIRHARQVARMLRDVATVTVSRPCGRFKDVADHLGAGHSVDELELVASDVIQTNGTLALDDWLAHDTEPPADAAPLDDDGGHGEVVGLELIDWSTIHDHGDEIVEGLVIPGRWTSLAARAKAGKTTLEMFVTVEISEGRDPFDGTPRDPVVVLYIDGEMGRFDLEQRLRELGHPDPTRLTRWYATDLPPRLDTIEGGNAVTLAATRLGAQVVVIDGVNGTVSGAEKDDTTWRAFFESTIMPLKRAGVAVLTGDNLGKDESLGPRGSSVKVDKPDAVIQLSRTDNGVKLKTTHRRTSAYPQLRTLSIDGLDGDRAVTYRPTNTAWPDGTTTVAALLDELEIPLELGRMRVRRLLDEAADSHPDPSRLKVRNDALAAAIRYRKLRAAETEGLVPR